MILIGHNQVGSLSMGSKTKAKYEVLEWEKMCSNDSN